MEVEVAPWPELKRGTLEMRSIRFGFAMAVVASWYFGIVAPTAHAGLLTVDAAANIFGSGYSTAPNPGGGSGGELPPEYSFASGSGQTLSITSLTGTVSLTPGYSSNGQGVTNFSTDITSYNGISGIIDPNRSGFLVGVFLTDSQPSNPAPSALTFGDQDSYTTLSPLIGQTFLIGTGQTSGGLVTFEVPTGATRLYLGFADAYGYSGAPGQYQDNSGSLQVGFTLASVPEPASLILLSSGLLGVIAYRRRRGTN